MKITFTRLYIDIAVGISVFILPWYISSIIIFGLMIYFPIYIEGLLFAFLFDTLYTQRIEFPFVGLITAFIFLIILYGIKTQIRK